LQFAPNKFKNVLKKYKTFGVLLMKINLTIRFSAKKTCANPVPKIPTVEWLFFFIIAFQELFLRLFLHYFFAWLNFSLWLNFKSFLFEISKLKR